MNIVMGTLDDHKQMIEWAVENNEKVLQFIPDVDANLPDGQMRPVFRGPPNVLNWLRYNCFTNPMQNYFKALHGEEYYRS